MEYKYTVAINQGVQEKKNDKSKYDGPSNFPKDPILAFIVSLKGANAGMDFPIYKNTVHIGKNMDKSLEMLCDKPLSIHLIIKYDGKENVFFIENMENSQNIYLNDNLLYDKSIIKSHDIVKGENIKFIFVPFCEEDRKWS